MSEGLLVQHEWTFLGGLEETGWLVSWQSCILYLYADEDVDDSVFVCRLAAVSLVMVHVWMRWSLQSGEECRSALRELRLS